MERLTGLLQADPSRFEATTAFRIAEAGADGDLDVRTHIGVSPVPLAVSGFAEKEGRVSIRSSLAGLTGPVGSMPPAYNEHIIREERNRSRGLASFLDLFSARMNELFVAACEKYRIARRLRWRDPLRRNSFVTTLLSLAGFGTAGLVARSGVDEEVILRFSGLFSARSRNATSLEAILCEFSGLPIEVEMFRGRWLTIPAGERSRLAAGTGVQLGVNATAGAAIHDFSGGFRVVVGPVGYEDYASLSPDGPAIAELFALTRLYVGAGFDFDIQVILRKEEVPFCRLGDGGEPPRLGWNSWARVAPAERDSGDAVISMPLSPRKAG